MAKKKARKKPIPSLEKRLSCLDCTRLVARIPVQPFQANPAEIQPTTGAIDYDGALVTCRLGLLQYAKSAEKHWFKRVLQGKDQVRQAWQAAERCPFFASMDDDDQGGGGCCYEDGER